MHYVRIKLRKKCWEGHSLLTRRHPHWGVYTSFPDPTFSALRPYVSTPLDAFGVPYFKILDPPLMGVGGGVPFPIRLYRIWGTP